MILVTLPKRKRIIFLISFHINFDSQKSGKLWWNVMFALFILHMNHNRINNMLCTLIKLWAPPKTDEYVISLSQEIQKVLPLLNTDIKNQHDPYRKLVNGLSIWSKIILKL